VTGRRKVSSQDVPGRADKFLTRRERAGRRAAPNQGDREGRGNVSRQEGQGWSREVLTRRDREGSRGRTDSAKRHMYTIIPG